MTNKQKILDLLSLLREDIITNTNKKTGLTKLKASYLFDITNKLIDLTYNK